ncbi:MAG: PAS domain S-box protein [Bacteroidales bacterium]|nr:PAS domain S-box protein [Bacteroidales bacterium]
MHFNLDIPTLIFILGTTHLMQVVVFVHQYRVNKAYPGVGWWLLWSAAEVVGFFFILLREIPSLLPLAIIIQNTMIVAGTIFLYIGVRIFLGLKVNLRVIIPIALLFLLGLLYFLFIDENLKIRSVVINATIAIIPMFTAYSLFKYKTPAIRASANFNAAIFLIHGCLFAYRTVMILMGVPMEHFLSPTLFNFLPFFDALIVSLLWTFGLIIMLNQRLNSDITDAKKELQQIFNTSPDAASITRLDDGLLVDINEGYLAITGYTREETIGKSSIEINIWKNISDRHQVVKTLKEKGYCENYEAPFLLKNGTEITGLMSAKIIHLQGIPHIISITRDISERKRIERDIELKNEQLRNLNTEKDKFISILAHDMRSPFNSFLGLTQLLVEDLSNMEFEEIHSISVSLNKSAVHLYRLLDNLLEWSYIQRGKLAMRQEAIEMGEKIYEITELAEDYASKKGIRISYEIPSGMMLFADIHMFETILRNLLFNAVKFSPEGGNVSITAMANPNDMTEISVSDGGIGIPEDIIRRLFIIDQSTCRKGTTGEPSTGLGLVICKEFVDRHGGQIKVESEEGKGSTFSFTLPSYTRKPAG